MGLDSARKRHSRSASCPPPVEEAPWLHRRCRGNAGAGNRFDHSDVLRSQRSAAGTAAVSRSLAPVPSVRALSAAELAEGSRERTAFSRMARALPGVRICRAGGGGGFWALRAWGTASPARIARVREPVPHFGRCARLGPRLPSRRGTTRALRRRPDLGLPVAGSVRARSLGPSGRH